MPDKYETRQLFLPKHPQCTNNCPSCPFLEGNDEELAKVLNALRRAQNVPGDMTPHEIAFARMQVKLDVDRAGTFICHKTAYNDDMTLKPAKGHRQCCGATRHYKGIVMVGDMQFRKYDAGRSESKRPKQKQDCVVRAYALAFGKPYDEAFDLLAKMGRKPNTGTDRKTWQRLFGFKAERKSFPAVAGQKRMNLERFAKENPKGTFVVQMAGHLTFVRDGVVIDDFVPRRAGASLRSAPTSPMRRSAAGLE